MKPGTAETKSVLTHVTQRLIASSAMAFVALGGLAIPAHAQEKLETPMSQASDCMAKPAIHLGLDDTLADLLNHPCLAGFAERTMPRADGRYDMSLPLRDIGSVLRYYTAMDPAIMIGALNRLIDDAGQGLDVFYEIYSDDEKPADPDLRSTGLFFFRGEPGAPFAVIAPGGAFQFVGSLHEGFPYAVDINRAGYNAFVVTYRTGRGGEVATRDMARAIDYILENADTLDVAADGYSVWGSSAGARMAAYIGSHGTAAFGAGETPRPSTVVMAYTGHSDIATSEPPTFVVVGGRDGIAPPAAMERRVAALRANGTEVEYHLYPSLGHGFGRGTGTEAEGWIGEAVAFWERQIAASD